MKSPAALWPAPMAERRRPRAAAVPLNALIAYADLAAARRAMLAINAGIRVSPWAVDFTPMLWRFDQLGRGLWRERSLADAAQADVIVLAANESDGLSGEIETWLARLIALRRNVRTTIVALLGTNDAWTISLEATAKNGARGSTPVATREPIAKTTSFVAIDQG